MTRIENETQYKWALEKVEKLLPLVDENTPVEHPDSIELELISNLVADYSDIHFSIGTPTLVDVIKLRMYEMGLNQKSLANLLGIKPESVKGIISGQKQPTYNIARNLSKKLDIEASVVLGIS